MSTIELEEPTTPEPAPDDRPERTDLLERVPAWVRFPLYVTVGILIMATAREISGAGALEIDVNGNLVPGIVVLNAPLERDCFSDKYGRQ